MTDDEIAPITQEAHRVGLPVAAHAQGAEGIKNALRNGVDTIEHGIYLDQEEIDLLLETGGSLVPTLAIVHRVVEYGEEHGIPEFGLNKATEAFDAHVDSVKRAHDAGVNIALGTDFCGPDLIPHGENAEEAELYVEAVGMSEMESIKASTSGAARALKEPTVGAVEPRRYADLVVLDDDPLSDISALRNAVSTVYKDGKQINEEMPMNG